MFFLHLYCKKENFLFLTTWLLLSSLGVWLTNSLQARASWSKQVQTSHIAKMKRLNPEKKCDQLSLTITEDKKFLKHDIDPILSLNTFRNIIRLKKFLIKSTAVCIQIENLKTQYFSNKRAPPFF
ncbi:hypothetical protein ABID23_000496 [Bartonella silvatica]|uniref:Uncharacterized protein n=1 Tax=Bartonella silvatica TaxID=357760 RepID=A0ABV2HG43_9HYPH